MSARCFWRSGSSWLRTANLKSFASNVSFGFSEFERRARFARLAKVSGVDQVASRSYFDNEMRSVGLKVLKNKLSEYVRLAEHGETILISDRDRVVAELVPPGATRSPVVADARLADLVRRGLLAPALRAPGPPPPQRAPVTTLRKLLAELGADREDR